MNRYSKALSKRKVCKDSRLSKREPPHTLRGYTPHPPPLTANVTVSPFALQLELAIPMFSTVMV